MLTTDIDISDVGLDTNRLSKVAQKSFLPSSFRSSWGFKGIPRRGLPGPPVASSGPTDLP